jgi:hypothetical protein
MDDDAGLVPEPDPMAQPVEPVIPRRARTFAVAILAIIAAAVALGIWTVALLEVEIVPPDIGTCGVVLTEIVHPHANEDAEVSPTICAEALAPAVGEAQTVFWVTVGFDAIGLPVIGVLAVKRRRIVRTAIAAAGKEVTPLRVRLRIAPIGWTALGLSLAGVALLYVALQTAGDSIEYAGRPHEPLGAVFSPVFAVLAWVAIPTAIALNSVAGTRGLGNRLIGILGGLILLSPFFYMAVEALLIPLRYP